MLWIILICILTLPLARLMGALTLEVRAKLMEKENLENEYHAAQGAYLGYRQLIRNTTMLINCQVHRSDKAELHRRKASYIVEAHKLKNEVARHRQRLNSYNFWDIFQVN